MHLSCTWMVSSNMMLLTKDSFRKTKSPLCEDERSVRMNDNSSKVDGSKPSIGTNEVDADGEPNSMESEKFMDR